MKADCYVSSGMPVIRGTNLVHGRKWAGDWVYVPLELAETMPNCQVNAGDIVFPHRGAIGEVGIVPDDGNTYLISSSLMKIKLDRTKSDPDFIYYYFSSQAGREEILKFSSSVGTPGIGQPLTSMRQFKILRFPLQVQKSIAAILGALDDKIDLNRRTNETLEAMARALFRDWFVDFGPTRAKMAGQTPYLASEIWELFPDRLDDEGNPEGWKTAAFSQFVSILTGGTPKTSVADYWDGDIPWFSVVDTPAEGDIYVLDTAKKITKNGLDHSAAVILPEDTVIITARGTVGKLAMTHGPMTMNQSCYGLRGTNGIGQYFVYQSIKNSLSEIKNNTHGSVFDTITRQTFSSISANLPSPEMVQNYEKKVAPFFQKALENVSQTQHLAQLRDLILPKLMSGEIRIRDAEKMVEDAL